MKYLIIGIICIIIVTITVLLIIKLNKQDITNNEKIENIQTIHFSYSTGYHKNASIDYELECNEECLLYFKADGIDYEDKKEYKVEKNIIKEIEEKLNEYDVIKWNNYNKSNKDVLDGNSFSIYIKYQDGKTISASGYESWPTNYSQVKNYLNDIFSKYINS